MSNAPINRFNWARLGWRKFKQVDSASVNGGHKLSGLTHKWWHHLMVDKNVHRRYWYETLRWDRWTQCQVLLYGRTLKHIKTDHVWYIWQRTRKELRWNRWIPGEHKQRGFQVPQVGTLSTYTWCRVNSWSQNCNFFWQIVSRSIRHREYLKILTYGKGAQK